MERGLVFDTSILGRAIRAVGRGRGAARQRLFPADIEAGRLVRAFDRVLESGFGYYLTVSSPRIWAIPRSPGSAAG